jgi:hypothetical protein
MSTPTTQAERQAFARARARERRAIELAPLRSEIAHAIEEVGWRRAKPVVATVLAPRWHVGGPKGQWWEHVGKRSGARILAGLKSLPVQSHFDLSTTASQPKRILS